MIEEWRPIEGYEGLYEVSNTGLVRNVVKGRFLKPGFDKNGYLKCVLSKGGKQRTIYIHRLVATAFIPNPLDLPQVNHRDENKSNNVADNLEWCTLKYNLNYGSAQDRRVQTNIDNGKYSGLKTVDIKEYRRMYYLLNKERKKEYEERNRERIRERKREYMKKNKEKLREKRKEYQDRNRERIREKNREYMRKYRKRNKEEYDEKRREYMREYRKRKNELV